jgi:hypothetical protein
MQQLSLRQLIRDNLTNPDGTGSTKRTVGWFLIITAVGVGLLYPFVGIGFEYFTLVFTSLLASGLSALGLSSWDYKNYINNNANNTQNINHCPTCNCFNRDVFNQTETRHNH